MAPDETDDGDDQWPAEDAPPTGSVDGDAGETSVGAARETPVDGGEDATGDDSPVSGGARAFVHGLVALGVTVLGVIATLLGVVPVVLFGTDTALGFGLGVVFGEIGFVVVALLFLLVTRRGIAYLDLALPGSRREWGIVAGFTLGAFLVRTVAVVASSAAGVQPAESSIANSSLPFEVLAVILLPTMLLVVGPAEELLFRGVIQKYVREETSGPVAIVVAGLLFGLIHVFSLVQAPALGTVVSLVVITAVGMGLGWLYEYTGSLPAAMLAHGGYNALIVVSAWGLQSVSGPGAVVLAWLA